MMTTKTAAGIIDVISSASSDVRNTTVWLGTLPDGRYVVASRWQVEIRTKDQAKAEGRFRELCNAGLQIKTGTTDSAPAVQRP